MNERIESLRRAVQYGLSNGKTNMIADLDVLQAMFARIPSGEQPPMPAAPRPRSEVCPGMGSGGTAPPCCDRVGEYNGYGSDGPTLFRCPKHCGCHD